MDLLMSLLANNTVKYLTTICIICFAGCKSTALDNNLDTQILASGSKIEFNWQDTHPFAKDYASQQIVLVAEYVEVSLDGATKPVRQVISRSNNRLTEINKKIFTLPSSMPSRVNTPNICLYLQMNRQAIPIRAANNADTARFSYPAWQTLVAGNTNQQIISQNLKVAERNLTTAEENIDRALAQQNQAIDDFNEQLSQDNTAQSPIIYDAKDCQHINVNTKKLIQPRDIIAPNKRQSTAFNICAARAYNSVKYARQISSKKIPAVKLLPFSIKFNQQNLSKVIANFDKNRLEQFKVFHQTYEHFLKNIAQSYTPELGSKNDILPISEYNFQLQSQAYSALISKNALTQEQINIVNEVYSNELEEFKSRVIEGQNQLKTKFEAWEIRKKAYPNRIKARKSFLKEKCDNLFSQNKQQLQILKRQETAADKELTALKQQFQQSNNTIALSDSNLILNGKTCQIQ